MSVSVDEVGDRQIPRLAGIRSRRCPQYTGVSIQSVLNNPPLPSLWSGCVEADGWDYPQMVRGLPGLAFRLAGEARLTYERGIDLLQNNHLVLSHVKVTTP